MRILATMIACVVLCSGCATITRGRTEVWSVQTDPAGATVKLSSGEQCTSPCSLQKIRKEPFQATIDLAGYHQVVTQIASGVKGAGAAGMAGNVIFGGLIGIGVDAATGAALDLIPNPLVVKLTPSNMPMPAPEPAVRADADDAPDSRAARMSSYGAMAKSEFAKMHCDRDFRFVSAANTEEIYQATCDGGKKQLLACDGIACKPTK